MTVLELLAWAGAIALNFFLLLWINKLKNGGYKTMSEEKTPSIDSADYATETQLQLNWKDKLASLATSTERYDKYYVAEVVKAKPDPETQKTLRHYQWCVTAFKIAAKIASAITIYNVLQKTEPFAALLLK